MPIPRRFLRLFLIVISFTSSATQNAAASTGKWEHKRNMRTARRAQVNIEIDWIISTYAPRTANVGGSVTFNWVGTHNVYIHPTGSCDTTGRVLVGTSSGATYTFTDDDGGNQITFACDIDTHCDLGQIVTFTVGDGSTSEPTSSPTSAPTMTPTAAPTSTTPTQPLLCFSGNMEVVVRHKGTVAMEKLQVGDFVKIGNSEAYEQVYAFGHRVPQKHAEFVQIHTNLGTQLEMTGEHLVFVHGKRNPVRADSIKVGDLLQGQDNGIVVQKIDFVTRNGIYNPLTASGTIQVNGITASTYISFQEGSNEYVELPGDIKLPLSHHDFAHRAMAPFRFYCTAIAICDINDSKSHIPVYVSKGMELVKWSKQQHIAVQLLIWGSFRMIVLASILIACAFLTAQAYFISGQSVYQLQRIVSLKSGKSLTKRSG